MPIEIKMPQLDQTMTEGKIGKWLVKEGENVKKGTPIVEIETDKVVSELESPSDGVLERILVSDNSKIPVKSVLAIISTPDETVGKIEITPEIKLALPSVATVRGEASVPISDPADGKTERIIASPAAKQLAGQHRVDLSKLRGTGPGGRIVQDDVQKYVDSQPEESIPERIKASPLARRLAQENGLDLSSIVGTGPEGRIVRDDVLKAAKEKATTPPPTTITPDVVSEEIETPSEQIIPLTGIRQSIAERMTQSARTAAIVTLNSEVDATALVELRTLLAAKADISYTDLLVKIVAQALRQHPTLNSTLAEDGIHILATINIGVAVALDDGLIVPVVREADKKGLSEISKDIKDLMAKARNKSLSLTEVRDGTFTITNLGMFGIDTFTPIINPPQCAILGVGRIIKKPVVLNDEIVVRSMLGLSLSFDHRIVDGVPAAQFLQTVAQMIAEPYLILL